MAARTAPPASGAQQFVHLGDHPVDVEWLVEYGGEQLRTTLAGLGAAHEDHRQVSQLQLFTNRPHQLFAIEHGHHVVGDHQFHALFHQRL